MAKFQILLFLVILAASLVINHATVRLPEWPGIPPKGYGHNVAKRLPEWPGIPPKGYDGEKTVRLPEWPGIPPKGYYGQKASGIAPSAGADVADASNGDGAWVEASAPGSAIPSQ